MNVLIADDDPTTCALLEALVASHGHQVHVCTDGAEAVQLLEALDAPRLALLDWMMPGLTGPEVCRHVRSRAEAARSATTRTTGKSSKPTSRRIPKHASRTASVPTAPPNSLQKCRRP